MSLVRRRSDEEEVKRFEMTTRGIGLKWAETLC